MKRRTDIAREIRHEIKVARTKWGETSELRLLLDSWRSTLDDEETLQALRSFTRTGRYLRKINGMAEDLPAAGDAREFVVVPPSGDAFDDIQMHARIEAALKQRFPEFTWHVTTEAPYRNTCFVVIPRLGRADARGGLLRQPAPNLMKEIEGFLRDNFAPIRQMH